jgi:hypothetical protein
VTSALAPAHRRVVHLEYAAAEWTERPCGLAWHDADGMRAQLARADVRATIRPAARQQMQLTLDCPAGRVRLPTDHGP